jgi:hypothetical protein
MKWLALLAAPLLALAVAGCGGGGGEETTSAPTTTSAPAALSKQQLISEGDSICAEVNAAVGTIGSSSAGTASPAAQEAELYSAMAQRLKALGTPRESAGYSEFSAAADELAQAEANVKLAAERGEESALPAAEQEASSTLTSFQSAASTYGFTDCSEGPHAPAPTSAGPATGGEGEEAPEATETEEPEAEAEAAPEAPEAGGAETGGAGGGAANEGGGTGGGTESSGGGTSGGIGPG